MADDPRIDGAVSRLMVTHPSWFKRLTTVRNRNPEDPGHADAMYAARTIAEAAVRGADAVDQLRALLADKEALFRKVHARLLDSGTFVSFADLRAVLAALREVVGL